MTRRIVYVCIACLLGAFVAGAAGYYALRCRRPDIAAATPAGRPARIWPDYADTVIPPNIAPLNFVVSEPGKSYYVKIHSTHGEPIDVWARDQKIVIPAKRWHKLLESNRGQKLQFDISIQGQDEQWRSFEPVTNTIAQESIDSHIAYRLITPIYNFWRNVGIYQRDIEGFDQSVILHNRSFGGCLNCHTFCKNNPDNMLLNVRPGSKGYPPGGMVVVRDGAVANVVNTRTDFNPIPAIYLAWHPSGELIAFSSNNITQFFHSIGETRDVFDHRSDLALYRLESNTVTSCPQISQPDRMETYPTWSPDGKYLYFCGAPQLPISRYKEVRYDLMRISYDLQSDTWGQVQTVLASDKTHLSVTHPKISPDGRWLLFCLCKYGNFSIYRPDSDLYMMDLETGKHRRLEINSDRCESWHCWSSNGRWIVFSSKRRDGVFAKPYFSYVDEAGKVYKPILLPQADPTFYDSFIQTFNVPQFITGPVPVTQRGLAKALYCDDMQLKAQLDPKVEVTAVPGAEPGGQYRPGPGG